MPCPEREEEKTQNACIKVTLTNVNRMAQKDKKRELYVKLQCWKYQVLHCIGNTVHTLMDGSITAWKNKQN